MKNLRLILMLFILPVCALAQGAQYTGIAQTARNMIGMGNVYVPIPGASVNVCTGVYTGTACPSGGNVTVYSNQALTTALTQPLTADNYGNFTFWAAPGAYYFTITGQGAATASYQITLPFGISGTYNATAKSIEQVRYADQFSGADWLAKLGAAVSDLPSTGGVVDMSGLTGTQNSTTGAYTLSANNVTILFGPGTYSMTGNFNVDGTGDTLGCKPPFVCTLSFVDNGTAASNVLWIYNAYDVLVKDLTVTQSNVTGRTGVYGTISDLGSTDVRLQNVTVAGGSGGGVYVASDFVGTTLHQANGFSATNSTVQNTKADGWHFNRGATHIRLSNLYATGTGDDGFGFVSVVTDDGTNYYPHTSDIVGSGLHVSGGGSGAAGNGISIVGAHDVALSGVAIDTTANSGIRISAAGGNTSGQSTYYPYHISISGGSVAASGTGVGATEESNLAISYARDVTVSGLTLRTPGSTGNNVTVAAVAKDINLVGLNMSQSPQYGIFTNQTSSNDARLMAELWTNLGDGAPTSAGISDVTITSPVIRNAALNAIRIAGETALHSFGFTVTGGTVYGLPSNQYGVFASYLDGSSFSGTAYNIGSSATGVSLNTGVGNAVTSNSIYTAGGGINLVGQTGDNVAGNAVSAIGTAAGQAVYIDNTGGNNYVAANQFNGTFSGGSTLIQDATSRLGFNFGDASAVTIPNATTFSAAVTLNGGGSIANGKTLSNAGTFNGAGTFDFSGGTTTLGTSSIASGKTLTNSGTISGGTVNATTLQQGGAAVALASQLPLSATVAGSITSLAANTCGDVVTQTVTGATTTMTPVVTVDGALPTSGLVIQAAVTAANTVSIEYCNVTTGSVVPAAATLEIRVIQ